MFRNKKRWIVVVAFTLIFAVVANFTGCGLFGGGTSNKIEVLTEPKMGATMVYTEYSPIVKAQVKNKSNGTVKVQLKCTIYGSDGSVTLNLTSLIMELAAGESTWLTANTSYSYSYIQYSSKCASFGNVEYRLY